MADAVARGLPVRLQQGQQLVPALAQFVVLALVRFPAIPSAGEGPLWLDDYSRARKLGQNAQKPLAVFLGDGREGHGKVSQEDSLTCIKLIGQEVFPAIREIAKSLDLKSPFEANAPVHLKYSTDLKPAKAAAAE